MKLEVRNISKKFENKQVLQGISLVAESGRAFGLLGRNGAGKTTAIRIIMDILRANGGDIFIDGAPIDYRKTRLGYLPEERGLYGKRKVVDQLIYFAELKGVGHKDAVSAIDYWLDRLEMTEYRNKLSDTLSKGNQQKIQMISVLAHDPQVIILDEPFSGLDPVNMEILREIITDEIHKGKIVFFSSHQMIHVEEVCDDIAILKDGTIILSGDLREIKRSYPRNRLVVQSEELEKIKAMFKENCVESDGRGLIITLESPDKKQEVMQKLTADFDIDELKVYEPSLNDIFIEYVGEQE